MMENGVMVHWSGDVCRDLGMGIWDMGRASRSFDAAEKGLPTEGVTTVA